MLICLLELILIQHKQKMLLLLIILVTNLAANHINYPIKFAYVNKIDKWWPQS